MPTYAGIGSRRTPDHILAEMQNIAATLAFHGWTLRSGHAEGADRAFESGHLRAITHPDLLEPVKPAEVYTPNSHLNWPSLERHASHFHPNWPAVEKFGPYVKRLHARNSAIILGPSLNSPVTFIVCWTPGGRIEGGTGQALRIAAHHKIPVYNLATHVMDFSNPPDIRTLPRQQELPL